jgi:hypothetical protein
MAKLSPSAEQEFWETVARAAEDVTLSDIASIDPYVCENAIPIFMKSGADERLALFLAKALSLGMVAISLLKMKGLTQEP